MPKYKGPTCTPRTFPETAFYSVSTSIYIYGYQTDQGFQIATLQKFEASYFNEDQTLGPITIAHFVLEEDWGVFKMFSLLSIGDRTRRLYFEARSGSQGEYQEICCDDLDMLKEQVAVATENVQYLQPQGYSASIPIVDTPMILLKLLVQVGLVGVSIKSSQRFGHLFMSQSQANRRRDAGLCIHCAYDCTDLPSPTCPECGQLHTILTG